MINKYILFSLGQLTPQHWMSRAVGPQISNKPLFVPVGNAIRETDGE